MKLYIYNSDSLLELAKIEGNEWLEKQKIEFENSIPNKNSFAFAVRNYNKTKHCVEDNFCIAIIEGKKNYYVYANGVITSEI